MDLIAKLQSIGTERLSNHIRKRRSKTITRRFIQEIFNEGKLEEAETFTHDIIYHGAEEVRGLEDFKEWIAEDHNALPDIEVTIVDDIGEQNNIALGWT